MLNKTLSQAFSQTLSITAAVLVAGFLLVLPDAADADGPRVARIAAHAVTGWNERYGEPVSELRFVGDLTFPVGGVYDPSGALPIDQTTPADALLATYVAPEVYLAFFNQPVTDSALALSNILYADYPQIISHASDTGPLPQSDEVPWHAKSNGAQVWGWTVGDWLRGRGYFRFVCKSRGENSYTLVARNLVPGGLYTIWGFYFDTLTGTLQPDFAFGGTSANAFTADKDGNIRGARALSPEFCPMRWLDTERYQLVNLFVVFHPDGRVNASVGHTVNTYPFVGPGVTATPHLMAAMPVGGF